MSIPNHPNHVSYDPCLEFLCQINQHRDVPVTELPRVVNQCFEKMMSLNFVLSDEIRQPICNVIMNWRNSAAKIADQTLVMSVHQTCINMLLHLNKSSIEYHCVNGILHLTEADYQILIVSCPSLAPHAKNLQIDSLRVLLAFLKHQEIPVEDLAQLYCDIETFAPLQLKTDVLKGLQHAIESTKTFRSILLTYFSYKNTSIRNVCAGILGWVLKPSLEAYPFSLKENGYVWHGLPTQVIGHENEPELFELVRGFECLRTHDHDTLHQAIASLSALNHNSVGLSFLLLHYTLMIKDLPNALKLLADIINFKPDVHEYRAIRADLAFLLNHFEPFKEDSEFLCQQFPSDPKFIAYRVLARHLSGIDDDANMQSINEVILHHGTPIAFYIRSKLFYHANNFKRALQDIKLFIAKQPGDFNGWFLAANISFQLGEWDMAKIAFEQALNLDPDNLEVRLRRASVFYHQKDIVSAIEDLKILLTIDPDHLEGLLLYAAYCLPKDVGTAQRLLEKLKSLEIEDSRIDELEIQLDALSHTASSA